MTHKTTVIGNIRRLEEEEKEGLMEEVEKDEKGDVPHSKKRKKLNDDEKKKNKTILRFLVHNLPCMTRGSEIKKFFEQEGYIVLFANMKVPHSQHFIDLKDKNENPLAYKEEIMMKLRSIKNMMVLHIQFILSLILVFLHPALLKF